MDVKSAEKRLNNIKWENLHDTFLYAMHEATKLLKQKAYNALKSSNININDPFTMSRNTKKYGRRIQTYKPLKDGIARDVADSGEEGRVRIKFSPKNEDGQTFGYSQWAHFALKWFDAGTKERFRNQKKTVKWQYDASLKRKGKRVKTLSGGIPTGKITANNFFSHAMQSTEGQARLTIENIISKSLNKLSK